MEITVEDYNRFQKATNYMNAGRYDKAVPLYKKLSKTMAAKQVFLNLGNCYRMLDLDDESMDCYLRAADHTTPFVDGNLGPWNLAYSNLGLLCYDYDEDDLAIGYYHKAIQLDPTSYNAIWNCGLSMLRKHCSGEKVDLDQAWNMYNYRFVKPEKTSINPKVKLWDGVSRVNKLVVLAEQGIGDRVNFARYIDCLSPYCDQIAIECPPELDCLFEHRWMTVRDGSSWGADMGVPYCTLPRYFNPQPHNWLEGVFGEDPTIPQNSIFVEWTGSTTHVNHRNRNTTPDRFVGLVKDHPVYSFHDRDYGNVKGLGIRDWTTTVKQLNRSRLLITVDTALAHVGGSLNIPTVLLQSKKSTDFRWGSHSFGSHNVWYPNVYVIRNPNNWDVVFKNLKEYLVAQNIT